MIARDRDDNIRAQIQFIGSNGTKRLTITDTASRLPILEVELDPEMLMAMLSNQTVGSVDGVPAWFSPMHDKIGKTHVHVSATWSQAFCASDDALGKWAEGVRDYLGGSTVSIQKHNQNRRSIVVRHYYANPEAAERWKKHAKERLDEQLVSAPGYGTPASDD